MRRLTLALDALPALREAARAFAVDLRAAATLAQLSGVTTLRLGVGEELGPVHESDVVELRRTARRLELRMSTGAAAQKLALEVRPDLVVLAGDVWEGCAARPLDPRGQSAVLGPLVRSLQDAGLPVVLLVAPQLDAVKEAHSLGVSGVEFSTAAIVDLPASERRPELQRLGDAVRLVSKLRLEVGVAGGLDDQSLPEVLEAGPAIERVVVGRALVSRALLLGIERAVRDYRALLA